MTLFMGTLCVRVSGGVCNQVRGVATRGPRLIALGQLDGQLFAVPPLLPRSDVQADTRVPEQPQRDVGMRGAVPALAVADDLAVRRDTGVLVHPPELGGRLEIAGRGQVARPLDVDG